MTDYIKGKFLPIVLVGMSRHNLLSEVNNTQIIADVLEERDIKINFGSEDSSIVDCSGSTKCVHASSPINK